MNPTEPVAPAPNAPEEAEPTGPKAPPPDYLTRYWANKQGLELSKEVFNRVESFYRRLPQMRLYKRWVAGWAAYGGMPSQDNPYDVTEVAYTGDENELANMRVPHLAALGRHLLNMIVQDRVALDPQATNTDYASEAQTQVAKGVLDYVVKSERLEKAWYDASEIAIACGMAWKSTEWDPNAGDWIKQAAPGQDGDGTDPQNGPGSILYIDPETKQPVREGKIISRVYMPWNVATDLSREDTEHIWLVPHHMANKYDLAAQYPEFSDDILALGDVVNGWITQTRNKDTKAKSSSVESDLIPVFTLYHAPTPACPNGRWAVLLSADILLADGGLPYDRLPLKLHTAGRVIGTQFGDSPLLHGLGIQTVIDKLISAVASNNLALAKQCLILPEGATYSPGELAEGLSALYVPVGPEGQMIKPESLQLTKSAPETYELVKLLVQYLAIITGVNGAMSGADPALQRELSGAAMVFLESQALRFVSGGQTSFNELVEWDGTQLVRILKRYSKSQKLARIAGKGRQFMMQEWSGAVFDDFDRVEIQRGNFAQNSLPFRMQLAENLRQGNLLDSKEQYFEVMTEGTADPLTESHTTRLLNIRKENELLSQGKPVRAIITDQHLEHIREHVSLLDRPDLRDGSPLADQVAQAVTEHVQEHLGMLQEPANASLLQLLGQQPLPPPGLPTMPGMPPGPPGAAGPVPSSAKPLPGPTRTTAPRPGSPPPGALSRPGHAGPPQMPKNPETGQRPAAPPGTSAALQ